MRRAVWLILVLSAAVGLALLLHFQHGNVSILWAPYRIDLSVNFAVIIVLATFVVMYVAIRAASQTMSLSRRVSEYRAGRRRERAMGGLLDAVTALFEGRFGRAERLAGKARIDETVAGVAALVGAKAAHAVQEPERRDHWLEVARESPSGTLAAGLLGAEIALDEDRPDDAVAEIDAVHSGKSRHIHALRLALRAYERAHDWQRALAVLGQLDKRDALPAAAIRGSKIRAYRALFKLRGGDADAIWDVYRSLGRRDRQIIEIVDAAAHALASAGDEQRAGRLVEEALAEQVSPRLLRLYARLTSVPARDRLARAEKWRDRHGDDPALLAAMGELCLAESLWGKAEDFLQRADKLAPSRVTRQLLGSLYERTERHDEAYRYYKLAAEDASPLTPEP